MEHFVTFDNVCKYYQMGENRIAAADHVTFHIEKGEFCIIVGPSGAGKTTVLNMLGGMDTCDEGHIWLDGKEVSAYNQRQLTEYRRYDVGFVFQFYNLVQNLPARWPKTQKFFCVTNPRARWTTKPANRCWPCCRTPAAARGAPSSSSRTTPRSPPWPTASSASKAGRPSPMW